MSARSTVVTRLRTRPLQRRLSVLVMLALVTRLTLCSWSDYGLRADEMIRKPHPALDEAPETTTTVRHLPSDPINVALVASEEELHLAMLAAKWFPADPVTLKSSLRIAIDVVAHRPYADAPVSSLYLWGRKQDLAFELPLGNSPKRRHHVRFWRSKTVDQDGRPLWLGAAAFDTCVGLSHETGRITHHIAADIDTERDKIIDDIRQAGRLRDMYWIADFQEKLTGKNGSGDPYHTDGRLAVGVVGEGR